MLAVAAVIAFASAWSYELIFGGVHASADAAVFHDGLGKQGIVGRPGFTVLPARKSWSFNLAASKGYRLFVYRSSRFLVMEAIGNQSRVSYSVRAQGRGEVVKADLGRLGRLNMRFLPTADPAVTTEPQGDCRGRKASVQKGVFRGHLMWTGEGGFSHAETSQVRGMSVRSFREVCKGLDAGADDGTEIEPEFLARGVKDSRQMFIAAYLGVDSDLILAELSEVIAGVRIERMVDVIARPSAVKLNGAAGLTMEPPLPFRGVGEYSEETHTWLGDLSVEFPGAGRVSLAGPSFSVRYLSD